MTDSTAEQSGPAGEPATAAGIRRISAGSVQQFRYYDLVMAAFVAILLLSNIIGAAKRSVVDLPFIGEWPFGAGVLFFPISYIIGDILTEVYGYASLPPAPGWNDQAAYQAVFGNSWRIVIASMLAFWAGEFANSLVLAKMKLSDNGRRMGLRFVASTIVGQGLDSLIFYPVAFYGQESWPTDQLFQTVLSQWAIKSGWEVILLPITIIIVTAIKRREGVDTYDDRTDFSPFRTRV
jgi:queuosine precursor transporter